MCRAQYRLLKLATEMLECERWYSSVRLVIEKLLELKWNATGQKRGESVYMHRRARTRTMPAGHLKMRGKEQGRAESLH